MIEVWNVNVNADVARLSSCNLEGGGKKILHFHHQKLIEKLLERTAIFSNHCTSAAWNQSD